MFGWMNLTMSQITHSSLISQKKSEEYEDIEEIYESSQFLDRSYAFLR